MEIQKRLIIPLLLGAFISFCQPICAKSSGLFFLGTGMNSTGVAVHSALANVRKQHCSAGDGLAIESFLNVGHAVAFLFLNVPGSICMYLGGTWEDAKDETLTDQACIGEARKRKRQENSG